MIAIRGATRDAAEAAEAKSARALSPRFLVFHFDDVTVAVDVEKDVEKDVEEDVEDDVGDVETLGLYPVVLVPE